MAENLLESVPYLLFHGINYDPILILFSYLRILWANVRIDLLCLILPVLSTNAFRPQNIHYHYTHILYKIAIQIHTPSQNSVVQCYCSAPVITVLNYPIKIIQEDSHEYI